MDEINEVKKAIRHENWKRMYEEYLNSGMTAKSWCEAQGMPVKTFYYRLKVLRRNLLKENEVHEIVPIKACGDKVSTSNLTQNYDRIHIRGNGVDIELPMSVSPEMMKAILQGIRSC